MRRGRASRESFVKKRELCLFFSCFLHKDARRTRKVTMREKDKAVIENELYGRKRERGVKMWIKARNTCFAHKDAIRTRKVTMREKG